MKRSKLFTVFHGFCWIRIVLFDTDPDSGSSQFLIRIRIQGNDTDSTNPDPPHWWSVSPNVRRDTEPTPPSHTQ